MEGRSQYEVLIAGGGPVGLLLANLLGQRGIRTLVVERRPQMGASSMAIGVTPPSLVILRQVGLDAACVAGGVAVERAVVHDRRRCLGDVTFGSLPAPYPFILCLPQADTTRILEEGLARFPSVTLRRGVALTGLRVQGEGVCATLDEGGVGRGVEARFLAGCDGHDSDVRRLLAMPVRETRLGQTFLMADFDDGGARDGTAYLWFTETGSVESFPLPGGRRRWVVLTPKLERAPAADFLAAVVKARAGVDLAGRRKHFESAFAVQEFMCRNFHRGPVVLCGDAAHVMSPIGGQGMNTGFGDADLLADVFVAVLREGADAAERLRAYDRVRQRAFRVAARRARRGMWLGTRTGAAASWLRSLFLRAVLLRPPLRARLPPYFAMLTIPGRLKGV
ncbi:MAG: FAD-dependent monooxygenase [Lentisphaerae bacterium]|nr:FAD-dependent monooxygenase [Lentisphaerota bacterium]